MSAAGEPRPVRRSDRGSALLLVIVFFSVLLLIVVAATPPALRILEASEEDAARSRLDAIERGVLAFYKDHGRLPSAAEGLDGLLADPGSGSWRGPYLDVSGPGAAFDDPRGGSFTYVPSGNTAAVSSSSFPALTRTVSPSGIDSRWRLRAGQEMTALEDAALAWQATHGSLPAGVGVLVPAVLGSDYGTDPWGTPYTLDAVAARIISAGPDRTTGTGDDLLEAIGS